MTSATELRAVMRRSEVAERYGMHPNTVTAWVNSVTSGFPKPFKINGKMFWRRIEIEAWEAEQSSRASGEATAA